MTRARVWTVENDHYEGWQLMASDYTYAERSKTYTFVEREAYQRAVDALKDAREGLDKFAQSCDPGWGPEYLARLDATLKALGEIE